MRRSEAPPEDEAGLVMALEHAELPVAGVQFHPESILTFGERIGMRLIENVVRAVPIHQRRRISREVLGG